METGTGYGAHRQPEKPGGIPESAASLVEYDAQIRLNN
jgi:hypothetical protein